MNATSSRDEGLVRKVGPWGLAASVVGIVVGAGIFAVPGALAAAVGPYAPLAFLVCGLAIGAVAICFAEGGSRMPTSGGVYGYIEAAFGPLTGYVIRRRERAVRRPASGRAGSTVFPPAVPGASCASRC
jgi:APA family basic amino acid/polyamine antiporter